MDEQVETPDDVFKETEATIKDSAPDIEAEETKGETEEAEPKEEATEEAEPPAVEDKKLVPIVALHDERRKAQAFKEELEQYKARYDLDEEAPDPVDDPEGYKAHVREVTIKELREEKISSSVNKMVEEHADYKAMETTFMVLAAQDPSLTKEMNAHPDPARFAYEKAKEWEDAGRERLRSEIAGTTKVLPQELTKSQKRNKSALSEPNLTKATAAGSNLEAIPDDEEVSFADSPF